VVELDSRSEVFKMKINEAWEASRELIEKGKENKLSQKEVAKVLARTLFLTKLGQIRDYEQIAKEGPFKYEGNLERMRNEKLIPEDVYEILKNRIKKDPRMVGPLDLKIENLLTFLHVKNFYAKQLCFHILDYLNISYDEKCLILRIAPGGMDLGGEILEQLKNTSNKYNFWSFSPYIRNTRKPVGSSSFEDSSEYVGPPLPPSNKVFLIDDVINYAENIFDSIKILRNFGYDDVEIIPTCILDYENPIGKKRLEKLGIVNTLYLSTAKDLIEAANDLWLITESQYKTAKSFLEDPFEFCLEIAPYIK